MCAANTYLHTRELRCHLICSYNCSASTTALLLQLLCFYNCSAPTTALLLQLLCFYNCSAPTTALLLQDLSQSMCALHGTQVEHSRRTESFRKNALKIIYHVRQKKLHRFIFAIALSELQLLRQFLAHTHTSINFLSSVYSTFFI